MALLGCGKTAVYSGLKFKETLMKNLYVMVLFGATLLPVAMVGWRSASAVM